MGLVLKLLSAPGLGKTFTSKKDTSVSILNEIARYGSPRTKVLWLTPLRSLRSREKYDLVYNFRVPSRYVHILPSKEEAGCQLMRKHYNPILSLTLCPRCPSKSACLYYKLVREFMQSDGGGIWIATHHFLPFAVYAGAKVVVVDEYDAMIPHLMMTIVPADEVEKLIKMNLIDPALLKTLHRRGMIYKWGDVYWIPMKLFFFHVALYARELRLLSATPPPREFEFELTFFDPEQVPDDIIDLFSARVRIEEEVLIPKRHRVETYVLMDSVYVRSLKRQRLYSEVVELVRRLGGKITVIVGSKRERERVRNMLERRLTSNGVRIATDSEYEYHQLSNADIRLITVGGLVNRGWDLDSDYVIAFWQYMPPDEKVKILRFLTDYIDVPQERLLMYLEYRKHIQTLFRCIRRYDKPHTLILLDSHYYDALMFNRTTRFLLDSTHTLKDLKELKLK